MIKKLYRFIIKIIVHHTYWSNRIYSQEGEDIVIDRYFQHKAKGFYVEVGAHHPFRFSNTYRFYRRGWTGVCIEPLLNCKKLFAKYRPNDIFINKGVGSSKNKLDYYMFNESALNTFDPIIVEKLKNHKKYKVISIQKVELEPLESILSNIGIDNIDFISIDVEGLDFEVIKSLDWYKYRPTLVIMESLGGKGLDFLQDPAYLHLANQGYSFYAKTGNSIILEVQEGN